MDTPSATLGVYVGPDAIDAVLVRGAGDGVEAIRHLSRPRARVETSAAAVPPGEGAPSDYTLEVGGQWASDAGSSPLGDGAPPVPPMSGQPFASELTEILGACAAAGYETPRLAFCLSAPDVAYVDLGEDLDAVPPGASRKGASSAKRRTRETLLQRVPTADVRRSAFVPVQRAAASRTLAVAVEAQDPVSTTLAALPTSSRRPLAAARLDAEVTLLASVVGRSRSTTGERTLVVRIGAQDTLVLFLTGRTLAGVERLRSLTVYDRPETVVSRVLLQQDETRAGDPDTVLFAAAGPPEAFEQAFTEFFPASAVEPLATALGDLGVAPPSPSAGAVLATALAARESAGWTDAPDVNLLPPRRRSRRRQAAAFPWATALAALLLVAVIVVAGLRYARAEAEVAAVREELRLDPPVFPDVNPDVLQTRVDSLNQAYAAYTRRSDVLDSLLVGSDRWTQAMRLVTRTTVSTGGTWLQSWTPDGDELRLTGQALAQPRIVELARRLNGRIQSIESTDIGARRVYTFTMRMPLQRGVPEAAAFLRQVVASSGSVPDSLAALIARHGEAPARSPARTAP